MDLVQKFRKLAGLSIAHVAFSFVAMGSWAVFANRAHPLPEPLIAGLVQGALSGAITYGMKKALEGLSFRFMRQNRVMLALVGPPLIVCSISSLSLIVSHAAAGTPELIATIIVPSSVALFYASSYTFVIWRKQKAMRP